MANPVGMTDTDAVNEIVETVGEFPTTASTFSATGTSIYDRASQFLRRETKKVLSQGWPENTVTSKRYVLAGGANSSKAELGSGTDELMELAIRGAGPDAHKTLVIRHDGGTNFIYDMDNQTFDHTANSRTDVFVDVVHALDTEANYWGFENCSPTLQDVIVAKCRLEFQRRIQGNPEHDQQLMQEYAQAEQIALRNIPVTQQSFNVQPMLGMMQSDRQQQQQ